MEAVYMNKKFNEILYDALQEQKEMEKREKIYKEKDMGKFVRLGNVIINTDNIIYIMDNGGKREIIMIHNFSYETDKTFGELLEILNNKELSYDWIPCSERLPEDLSEVNVTWINTDPEPYYDFIKGERFTGSAVYYKGKWYWYSSTTKDVLAEYGRYDSEEFDEAIECIAWMPLPTSYIGDKT